MNVDNITCPAIAILYKNGTLKPDADGFCTYQQLFEAAQTLGLGKVLADGAAGEAKKAPDKKINIFDLGGAAQTDGKSVGFKYISGMRRPADEERLKEIMGDKEAFTLKDLKALNKQVKRSAERLAAGNSAGPPSFPFAWTVLLKVFGGSKCQLTMAEMHAIFIDSSPPSGWEAPKPIGLLGFLPKVLKVL